MNVKLLPLLACSIVLALPFSALRADEPTSQQKEEIEDCGTMAKAVLLFAEARDQGLSKPDAFQSVTRGETPDLPGSPVDQTEQWAYDHPKERADAASAHFFAQCKLDVMGLLNPATEAALTDATAACQKDHDKPDELRDCVDGKTAAVIAKGGVPGSPPKPGIAAEPPPSLPGIGKIALGMPMADAKKVFPGYGDRAIDAHGAPDMSFMISDDHGFAVLYTEPGKPDTVFGVEWHGGADVEMDPVLGLKLGMNASHILAEVGQPSHQAPMADGDDTLWSYYGRNYSFILSSGGDLIGIRVYGYAGLPSQAPAASTAPAP